MRVFSVSHARTVRKEMMLLAIFYFYRLDSSISSSEALSSLTSLRGIPFPSTTHCIHLPFSFVLVPPLRHQRLQGTITSKRITVVQRAHIAGNCIERGRWECVRNVVGNEDGKGQSLSLSMHYLFWLCNPSWLSPIQSYFYSSSSLLLFYCNRRC